MLKNKSRVIFGMICSTFWKLLRGGLNPIAPLLWSLVNWIKKRIFKTIGLALSEDFAVVFKGSNKRKRDTLCFQFRADWVLMGISDVIISW